MLLLAIANVLKCSINKGPDVDLYVRGNECVPAGKREAAEIGLGAGTGTGTVKG